MPKDSENIDRIKRNYTEATLAHAESNLGDSPGITPPAFKLHVQQNAFKASERSMLGQGSFQLKESGQASAPEEKKDSGASFIQNFQSRFNTDLSDVKVHKNSEEANKMGTKAFAKGNQIHFANGAYQPDSKEGQKVLGHELVHVLQQRKGRVDAEGTVNGHHANDNPGLEHEATQQADKADKNQNVSPGLSGAKAGNVARPVAQGFLGGIFKKVGGFAKSIGNSVVKGAQVVGGGISNVVGKVGGGIKKGIGWLGKVTGLGGIGGKIAGVVKKISSPIKKGISKVGGWLGKGAKSIGKGIKSIGKKIWGGIQKGVGFGKKLLQKGLSTAKNLAKTGGKFVLKLYEASKSKIGGLIKRGVGAASALAIAVKDKIKQGAGNIFKAVGKIASDPIGALKTIVTKAVSGGSRLLGFASGIGKKVLAKAARIVGFIKKRGSGFWKGLKEVGGGIFGVLKSIGSGLGGGVLQMAKGNFLSGLKMMGMGVVNGIMGTLDVILDSTVGMLDYTFGAAGEGKEVSGKEIPKRHIMDEYCAHSIAYKDASALAAGTAMSAEEQEVLKKGGYDPDNMHVRTGPNGFQAVLIMPLDPESGIKPMLAMRGTADLQGVITDTDPQQVGHNQFQNNKETIEGMIKMAGGQVDVTGHSLGGAMAQITAAHFTSSIGRVTTFQSPGINKETVKLFSENVKKNKGKGPEVNHHTVKNDLVSKAGQENLPGTTYEHDLGEISPLEAHTSWTSGTADRRADRADYGMTDKFFNDQIGKEIYDESTITKFKTNPHYFKRVVAEALRGLVGTIRDGGVGLFNLGKIGASKAWGFMQKVGSGIKKMSAPAKKLLKKLFKNGKRKGIQLLKRMTGISKLLHDSAMAIINNIR